MVKRDDKYFTDALANNPGVEESTTQAYISSLKRGVNVTGAKNIYAFIKDPDAHIPLLKEKIKNINCRVKLYIAIITAMRTTGLKFTRKEIYNKWYKQMMVEKTEVKRSLMLQVGTEEQNKNELEWEDVIKMRDSLDKTSPDYLLLAVYTYLPPRRQEDYARMRIYMNPEDTPSFDHNHCHMAHPKHGPYFFYNKFKTVKKMGSFFNNRYVDKRLVEAIKLSMEARPREYLFVQANDKPFNNTNSYTKYSNGVLKRLWDNPEMSVNTLRHSFSQWFNRQPREITMAEHSIVAKQMGHTVNKNRMYNIYKEAPAPVFLPYL